LSITQRSYPFCHREVREARHGDPAGLLRRSIPRNDKPEVTSFGKPQ